MLCHCGDGNLADDIETTKQRAQGNGMQLSKMMEWEIWGLGFWGGGGLGERLGAEEVVASERQQVGVRRRYKWGNLYKAKYPY